MPRISTDNLLTGMLLKGDVKDLSGRMLLKSGTEIEKRHIKVLRTWGVTGVDVDSGDNLSVTDVTIQSDDLPPELIKAVDKEIEGRFAGVDISHPVMMALVDEVKRDLIKQQINERDGG